MSRQLSGEHTHSSSGSGSSDDGPLFPFTEADFWTDYLSDAIDVCINCVIALGLFLIFYLTICCVSSCLKSALKRTPSVDSTVSSFMITTLKLLLWIIIVPILVQTIGISASSITSVIGAVVVGIGFSLRPLAESYVMGIFLAVRKPFVKGDLIRGAGKVFGFVEELYLSYTVIREPDGNLTYVPNKTLWSGPITNITTSDKVRLDVGRFELAHNVNLAEANEAIMRALTELKPLCMAKPAPPKVPASRLVSAPLSLRTPIPPPSPGGLGW